MSLCVFVAFVPCFSFLRQHSPSDRIIAILLLIIKPIDVRPFLYSLRMATHTHNIAVIFHSFHLMELYDSSKANTMINYESQWPATTFIPWCLSSFSGQTSSSYPFVYSQTHAPPPLLPQTTTRDLTTELDLRLFPAASAGACAVCLFVGGPPRMKWDGRWIRPHVDRSFLTTLHIGWRDAAAGGQPELYYSTIPP